MLSMTHFVEILVKVDMIWVKKHMLDDKQTASRYLGVISIFACRMPSQFRYIVFILQQISSKNCSRR